MASIDAIRFRVADKPKRIPQSNESPEYWGMGDGTTVTWMIPTDYEVVTGSLVLYTSAGNDVWIQVPSNAYTYDPVNYLVTFNVAPASGLRIGGRYKVTAFQDSDLLSLYATAFTEYNNDDQAMKKVELDVTGIMLIDPTKLRFLKEGEYEENPAALARAMELRQKQLVDELSGKLRANVNLPSVVVTQQPYRPTAPRR